MSARVVASAAERELAFAIRREVFVGEQGIPAAEEFDALDDGAEHLLVLSGGRPAGTCRLLGVGTTTVRLGRMAVTPRFRGRGLAAELLALADKRAREAGARRIVLDAQITARGLYERSGYTIAGDGEVFIDAGIEHVAMVKALT